MNNISKWGIKTKGNEEIYQIYSTSKALELNIVEIIK